MNFTNGDCTVHLPDTYFIVNARLTLGIIQTSNYGYIAEEAYTFARRTCLNRACTVFCLGVGIVQDTAHKTGRDGGFNTPGSAAHFVDLVHGI